jgi:hypothetical protein
VDGCAVLWKTEKRMEQAAEGVWSNPRLWGVERELADRAVAEQEGYLAETLGLGAVVRGAELSRVLGIPSASAMYMSHSRGTLPPCVSKDAWGKGYVATARDVALWLAYLSVRARAGVAR